MQSEQKLSKEGLERYVGTYVTTKVPIPADRRGFEITAGTCLFVRKIVGAQHFHLDWPTGRRAANQVHYSKLCTYGADLQKGDA